MAWVGFGMVVVGAVLIYSAYKGLHPWTEFQAALRTGQVPGSSSSGAPSTLPGTVPSSPANPGGIGPGGQIPTQV